MKRALWSVIGANLLFFLSGCSMPVGFSAASWVIDGASYITTKKSLTDHGISFVAGQDCALYRLVTEMNVCQDYNNQMTSVVWMVEASDLIENKIYGHHMNEIFYGYDLHVPPADVRIYDSLKNVPIREIIAEIRSD